MSQTIETTPPDSRPPRSTTGTLMSPAFLIVCTVLLLAAVTLNGATQRLRLHFKKEPVPQPREFKELPPIMGHWLQVSQDEKMDRETQDVLGTEKYLYRDYVNVDIRGIDLLLLAHGTDPASKSAAPDVAKTAGAALDAPAEAADLVIQDKWDKAEDNIDELVKKIPGGLEGKTPDDRKQLMAELQRKANDNFDLRVKMIQDGLENKTPDDRKQLIATLQSQRPARFGDKVPCGIVDLGLTYYTGLVDTVAHIPDRCYIADGYEPSDNVVPTWTVGKDAAGNPQQLQVRFISFDDQTGNNRVSKTVAYVFHANGAYTCDPLGVRQTLQDLTKRYGYYAKIEMMTVGRDPVVATTAMSDFLTAAKPQIETCFPDWQKLVDSHR
jgi:hypothetical protein